jgi:predicted dehydrogenase
LFVFILCYCICIIADLAEKQGKILMADQTFVYEDAVDRIKNIVQSGDIGDLLYYDSTRINLGLIQRDTNVLWDLAIHDLSILNHIRPITDLVSVLAYGQKFHTDQIEMAHLHLGFNDGFSAHVHVSWVSPVKLRQTLIGGTEKMIVYDDNQPSEKVRIYDKGVTVNKEEQTFALPIYRTGDILIPRLNAVEPLKILAAHFCKCIRGEEQPKTPAVNSLRIIEILELADQSMREGRIITKKG